MKHPDLLYHIFEQHLFNALVEDETSEQLLDCVVKEYIRQLSAEDGIIPASHLEGVETDLKEEVLEMLRKKTYGHYNLADYRKAHAAVPLLTDNPPRSKARRGM